MFSVYIIVIYFVLSFGWCITTHKQETTSLSEPERIEMHQQMKRYNPIEFKTACDGDVWYSVPCNCNFEG